MDSSLAGTPVSVSFDLLDATGAAVTPTALAFLVEDAGGSVILGPVALDPAAPSPVSVTVPAVANVLEPGVPAAGRVVRLTITTADASIEREAIYVLRSAQRVSVFTTSFQSYVGALALASTMPDLTNFPAAARPDQELALILAYRRLAALAYVFNDTCRPVADPQAYLCANGWEQAPWVEFEGAGWHRWWMNLLPGMWPKMTPEIFGHYPARFRDGLMRAQVYEADAIMAAIASGGRSPQAKREAGILSESIGESSMMFRSGKPLATPVCPAAMREVRPFLNTAVVLTRA